MLGKAERTADTRKVSLACLLSEQTNYMMSAPDERLIQTLSGTGVLLIYSGG